MAPHPPCSMIMGLCPARFRRRESAVLLLLRFRYAKSYASALAALRNSAALSVFSQVKCS